MSDTRVTDRMLPTRDVCRRYDVSSKTIERWQADPKLNFPSPLVVNNRKYFSDAQLTAWERSRMAAPKLGERKAA